MRLHHNWRRILARAWSVRFMAAAAIFTGLEAALPLFTDDPPIGRSAMAAVTLAVTVGAFASRLVAQKGMDE
ncbi:hypothetical protein [Terrarubrum flagellatum]|uniref:DUF7940 domain-containing protein n=1 Tax=Terrirubrum flagellatum TaxID=2895980 RepID=UPI003144FEF3